MKTPKNNIAKYFIAFGALFLFFGFNQIVKAEAEVINNFNAVIAIQKDGAVFVSENIIYNFGSNQKHGIYRDIPLIAENGPRIDIAVSSVNDEAGNSYKYTTSIEGDVLRIKIGDPDTLISGVKTYVINYKVYGAIRTFNDHDELYWNVTGNEWPVAIQNAKASVSFPDMPILDVKMDCFTGSKGSAEKNCDITIDGSIINYSANSPFNAGEGLTLVFGVPLGYINNAYVSPQKNYSAPAKENSDDFGFIFLIFLIISVLVIVNLFISWRTRRTKPKPVIPKELKGKPVVVEYSPPDDLLPIEIGALLDRRVDITDISSVIMNLAVRGYIKIRYIVKEIPLWPDKKDFELLKLKDGADLEGSADKIIFKLLFSGRDSVILSDLKMQKTAFQKDIKEIQISTAHDLQDKGYFDKAAENKIKFLKIFLYIMIGVSIIRLFVPEFFSDSRQFLFIIFLVAFITLSVIIARFTNKLTIKGISALAKILGFREFLQLTEKDKLELLNAPDLRPEIFEKFLPYAMVLGVEDKWAKKFEGIYNTIPDWYEDPTAGSFNSYILARNLTFFDSSFNQVFNITSPSSSSGFGGGGFSGGGSGGGGGGSW